MELFHPVGRMMIELPFDEIMMNEVTEFIRTRRSVVIRNLNNQPVPQADLDLIIDCGMRVPDHAVLAPWRLSDITRPSLSFGNEQF